LEPRLDSTKALRPKVHITLPDHFVQRSNNRAKAALSVASCHFGQTLDLHENSLRIYCAANSFSAARMKLTIHHTTTYRYAHPVVLQPHRMMLRPRGSHDVAVLASSLVCSPAAQLDWTQDVFGNLIATGSFIEPAAELVITSELTVEHLSVAWPVFRIAPEAHAFPFQYSSDDLAALGALRIPEAGDPDRRMEAWARAFVRGVSTDTLSLLKDVNSGILGPVAYRVRDEEGTQTPLETLALASGSCRDIAALFIAAVRHLGFGARAVSGYLYDPQASAEDPGSTHAWGEVYLPGAGWIAFDPTHRRLGGANLIPVAVARSNRQIMPIIGGYVGAPEDFLAMNVAVSVRPDIAIAPGPATN